MDTSSEKLKSLVRDKYDQIARSEPQAHAASCCGATASSQEVYNIMTDDYTSVEGYVSDADLGLGCGLPTQFARISRGDTVLDLGSGAGNDCFVARHETGPEGKVIGVDFTPSMIQKARINADKLGFNNVEFREGDIEDLPLPDDSVDVVVSNCVLNLVPNKPAVIGEIWRVLKAGGHFSISDIVLIGDLPEALRQEAEMYAGCVAGAIQKDEYLAMIKAAGFENITIQKEKPIKIPSDILSKYLEAGPLHSFLNSETGIFSVTVYAEKTGQKPDAGEEHDKCHDPGSGCC